MKLAIDIGNTSTKWATFEGEKMIASGEGWPIDEVGSADEVLVCASGNAEMAEGLPRLGTDTRLPLTIGYKTPTTLGADRVAAACGAWALHRGNDCLVIDAGTCITVDFVDAAGTYHGGAIMPGVNMNLQALHTFTAKLPLIEIAEGRKAPVLGRTTEESIVAGTLGATQLALAGFVALYKAKSPKLQVVLTGGAAGLIGSGQANGWEYVPLLTLIGLNEIMNQHEK